MVILSPLVIDGQKIADQALTLIAILMLELRASVALQDLHRREAHIKLTDTWWCHETSPHAVPIGMRDPDNEQLWAPINGRWKLWAAPDMHFSAGAAIAVRETAKRLADFLPAEVTPDVSAPAGGAAGGSSGPAELGIPVEWVRKIRGN